MNSFFCINNLIQVEIVGLVLEVAPEKGFTNYKLDDGSDCIDVKSYSTGQTDELYADAKYYRVCGQLKETTTSTADGSEVNREILALQIHPIENFNEITYHILNVIYAHLVRTRGPLPVCIRILSNNTFLSL